MTEATKARDEYGTEIEKNDKDLKKEEEARRKDEEAKREAELKKPAKGPLFGGKVSAKSTEASDVLQEVYDEGYTPILLKCTRGEQKCELGDKAYQITVTDPQTGEDKDYIFLIPGPVIQFLTDATAPIDGMSVQEFGDYQTKRNKRRQPKPEVGPRPDNTLPSRPAPPIPSPIKK